MARQAEDSIWEVDDLEYNEESWTSVPVSEESENEEKLEKKPSKAGALTKAILYGSTEHIRSQCSLKEPVQSVQPTTEKGFFSSDEDLADMNIENVVALGDKEHKHKTDKNFRAKMGKWKLLWHDFKNWYRRWKVKNQESSILNKQIKNMESNFGSAIGSLFVFTRWLMYLNFGLSLCWLGFLILPAAAVFPYNEMDQPFAFKNLIDGKGAVAISWMFYGGYHPEMFTHYPVGLVYLLLLLVTYFGSLFSILGRVSAPNESQATSAVGKRYKFSLMLWTSWDHTITSAEAAVNLSKGITSALKDNMHDAQASLAVKTRSRKEKAKVYGLRTLAWFITLILIGGGCSLIVYLVLYVNFSEALPNQGSGDQDDFISAYSTTIVFCLINMCVPFCIKMLPMIENYTSGRDELYVTLGRIFCLRMANLFSLIISLYKTVMKDEATVTCTGTVIGQELYKVVIVDTLIDICGNMLLSFTRHFWNRVKYEFSISGAVLVLVYRQAIIWAGTLACPVMPVIGLVSNIAFFYSTYFIVSRTCKPPVKRWNQSRNTSFFSIFLLASLAFIIPAASIVMGSIEVVNLGKTLQADTFCGPFGENKPTSVYTKFLLDQSPWLQTALRWLMSEPVLLPVFIITALYAIHQRRVINMEGTNRLMLQVELTQERDENEHLIKKLQGMGVNFQTK